MAVASVQACGTIGRIFGRTGRERAAKFGFLDLFQKRFGWDADEGTMP